MQDPESLASPFVPMNRAQYDFEKLSNQPGILGKMYPEVYRCLQSNTCTRICPMEIQVMDYIVHAIRGDVEEVAMLSFQCIMCGACTSKCPAEISQPNVALLARRVYGRHIFPIPDSLHQRVADIEKGQCDGILDKLAQLPIEELTNVLYTKRTGAPGGTNLGSPKSQLPRRNLITGRQ